MQRIHLALGAVVMLGIASAVSAPAQIVTNGGFETGDFTGWQIGTGIGDPWTVNSRGATDPTFGNFYAATGCVGATCIGSDATVGTNYLYEDLSTVVGTAYQISYYFESGGFGSGPEQSPAPHGDVPVTQQLVVSFGGTTLFNQTNMADTGLNQYVFQAVATSTTTRLEFQDREDPSFSVLDNVEVDVATPEPGTTLLGFSALVLFPGMRRFVKTRRARLS